MFFAHQMVPPDAAADPPIVSAFSTMATDAPFFPSAQRRTQSTYARARYYDVVMVRHYVSPVNIRMPS